jgi:4-oxalmesaconate hydratase
MIIDAHAHLVTPMSVFAIRSLIEVSGGHNSRSYLRGFVTDDEIRKLAAENVALMDAVGTDMQLLSPRPFTLMHSHGRFDDVDIWVGIQNDLIQRVIQLHPDRFRGVCALPQVAGQPIDITFAEMDRCVDELGFIGVLVNPDPDEGRGNFPSPRLGDRYWYPLWERLTEKNLPAHIHSAACYGRENYDEHFASEESLAITSIVASSVFKDFPKLRLMISHGGGSIPYQVGRWRAHWYRNQCQTDPAIADYFKKAQAAVKSGVVAPSRPSHLVKFDEVLKKFYFDTDLHDKNALELLLKTVGSSCCLFGTERPGSGSAFDPETGRQFDDIKPNIESIEFLSELDRQSIFEGNARRVFPALNNVRPKD